MVCELDAAPGLAAGRDCTKNAVSPLAQLAAAPAVHLRTVRLPTHRTSPAPRRPLTAPPPAELLGSHAVSICVPGASLLRGSAGRIFVRATASLVRIPVDGSRPVSGKRVLGARHLAKVHA